MKWIMVLMLVSLIGLVFSAVMYYIQLHKNSNVKDDICNYDHEEFEEKLGLGEK